MHWVFSPHRAPRIKTGRSKNSERHLFIEKCRNIYAVSLMCQMLKVSKSGYYRWLRNRTKQNGRQLLAVKIEGIYAEHPDNDNYGVRRMQIDKAVKTLITMVCKSSVFVA